MLNPKIVEIRYSIELTETQSDLLLDKCASDFITYMESQTHVNEIVWVFGMVVATIFFTIHQDTKISGQDSIEKVISFLEETLGTE